MARHNQLNVPMVANGLGQCLSTGNLRRARTEEKPYEADVDAISRVPTTTSSRRLFVDTAVPSDHKKADSPDTVFEMDPSKENPWRMTQEWTG